MNWSLFSQTLNLKPKEVYINNELHFSFTIPQSKQIAKLIISGLYADSVNQVLEQNLLLFERTLAMKEMALQKLTQQRHNLEIVHIHNQEIISGLEKTVAIRERQLKKQKRQKVLLGIGAGVIGFLVILK
ncbi:hypothetical protein GCM10009122_23330 [Fulvivirga kasyanovii]